jgi:hypothetical protein
VEVTVWAPVVTAALTLANTIVLWWMRREVHHTRRQVNGLLLQQVYEAEQRGRRLERARLRAGRPLSDDPDALGAMSARVRTEPRDRSAPRPRSRRGRRPAGDGS